MREISVIKITKDDVLNNFKIGSWEWEKYDTIVSFVIRSKSGNEYQVFTQNREVDYKERIRVVDYDLYPMFNATVVAVDVYELLDTVKGYFLL